MRFRSLRPDRFSAMAQVAPAERDLRRVIGDGDALPDGEVEGLAEADLLSLYRDMVLLRTYDERSLVYHRQGRIGTYAIFWGTKRCRSAPSARSPSRTGSFPRTASPPSG